jgi:hypothetical protein
MIDATETGCRVVAASAPIGVVVSLVPVLDASGSDCIALKAASTVLLSVTKTLNSPWDCLVMWDIHRRK